MKEWFAASQPDRGKVRFSESWGTMRLFVPIYLMKTSGLVAVRTVTVTSLKLKILSISSQYYNPGC